MSRTCAFHFLTALAAALAVLLGSGAGRAAPKKSDAEAKVTATADKPDADGKQVVTVTLDINPGWHAYANPAGNDSLQESQVVVAVKSNGKAVTAKVDYPPGKSVTDAAFGNYKVYEDKVTIKATVQRAKDDTGPLEVSVTVQVCNEKTCLLPATVKVNVP